MNSMVVEKVVYESSPTKFLVYDALVSGGIGPSDLYEHLPMVGLPFNFVQNSPILDKLFDLLILFQLKRKISAVNA